MNGLDEILSVVENPTRRKILQAVVREPHYPLQLSRELGISQQAVVKNLAVMEKSGMVISYRESSDRGPDRIFYRPSSEFTVIIDMRDGMFDTRMITGQEDNDEIKEAKEEETHDLEDTRKKIADIDKEIAELDEHRSILIGRRNELIHNFTEGVDRNDVDYGHRTLLYEMLNRPELDISEMSREMGLNEGLMNAMMEDILRIVRNRR